MRVGTRGGSSVVGAMDMYVPCTAREEVQHVEMMNFEYDRVPFRPSPLRLYDDDTSDPHQPTPALRRYR